MRPTPIQSKTRRAALTGNAPKRQADDLREKIEANHARLRQRAALHARFGFDSDASVRFVVDRALPLSGQVLDVGTGKGRFAVALARHAAHVTTVDVSAEEQTAARLEALFLDVAGRIDFVLADARALPWRAASFDAVVSWNVIHHLEDPEGVFGEMLRVLKPGGKLVLADFSPSGFELMDRIHAAEGRRHPHPPSPFPGWRARLKARGFQVRRFVGCHEEVLVAIPIRPRADASPPAGGRSSATQVYRRDRFTDP